MNRVANALMLMCFLIVFGTIGYVVVEGWKPADGLFMTVITLSTVGYGETNELTANGRNFTSLLIFLCLVSMTYWSASLTSFIVEQELNGHFARKRVIKMISQLKEHVVICGSGPIAKALIERLTRKRIPVVLVDENKEELDGLKRRFRKLHVLVGSPTNEMILAEANVIDAKTVVAAMPSEIDNLLVGITCKDLGGEVEVIARSNDPLLGNRMRKAGIDEVVSPSQLCGEHMAQLINIG
jgi:voltage-gated potassium channel